MKRLLKRSLFGDEPIPQWVVVGLPFPQQQVKVWLHGLPGADTPLDVTANNVVAALRPFTIAMSFAPERLPPNLERLPLELAVQEVAAAQPLGRIRLRYTRQIRLPDDVLCLFETTGHVNHCVSPLRLRQYYLAEWWAGRKQRTSYNFNMARRELHSLLVFYICPRPVVLVTVSHEGAGNMFPMDLIGPTHSPYFLMALRLTSPAVRLMQASRRMALSHIPVEFKSIAYDLGKHHKSERIDFAQLPFPTMPSPTWELPGPEAALRIREVAVEQTHEIGSHMLFITRIVHETIQHDGLQMHHIPGLYQHFRKGIA